MNTHRRYEVVLFDVGDTLIRPRRPFVDYHLDACRRAGVPVDPEKLVAAVEAAWDEVVVGDATATFEATETASRRFMWKVLCRIFDLAGIQSQREAIFADLEAIFKRPESYEIFPDALPTLAWLREHGYRLGIVSNWNWYLPELCQQLELAGYFDFIVASARAGCAKPHPRIFEIALRHAQVPPDRVVHIGDSLNADVRGAQSVGITGILLDRANRFQPDSYPKIQSLAEVPDFLSRYRASNLSAASADCSLF